MPDRADGTPSRDVEFYTRPGCHLCDEARGLLARECAAAGRGFREIDVDADPVLRQRYGEYVPVVVVDGDQVGYWRIDPARLRSALGGGEAPRRRWFNRRTRG